VGNQSISEQSDGVEVAKRSFPMKNHACCLRGNMVVVNGDNVNIIATRWPQTFIDLRLNAI
jgi:hypothetical protein